MPAATTVDIPELEFAGPIAGFPEHRRFVLVRLDEDGLLLELRSLDEEDLRFVVVPPLPLFPDYVPEVDDDAVTLLELESADDALVFLVVSVGETLADSTANLLAPVIVNQRIRRAAQVLLTADLPLRQPLRPA